MAYIAAYAQNARVQTKIRHLRDRLGLSQELLAERAGISTSQVSRYESGKASLFHPGAERLADALGVSSIAKLLADVEGYEVEIMGLVGAGAEVIPIDDGREFVTGPPDLRDAIAVRVVGDSMVPAYYEGDILFATQEHLTDVDIINRDCIVQVTDGPRLIKRVLSGSRKGLYRLLSYQSQTVSDDRRLDWAAPVRWVKR